MKPKELWVIGGTLYTQDKNRSIFKAHLRIENGQIRAIQKSMPRRIPKTAQVMDATNLTILPGFVQAHVHFAIRPMILNS
jgi:dihydroorotase-like cyclic amidohydrolase